MDSNLQKHNIHVLYAFAFLFNLAIAIPTYVTSTFLSEFMSETAVGLLYTIGSIVSVAAFAFMAPLLRRLGNYKTALLVVIIGLLSLSGLAFVMGAVPVAISFLVYFVAVWILGYNGDLFLERFSKDATTGGIRGAYLSISSVAWVFAPVISGFVLGVDSYWRIYTLAGVLFVLLIPLLIYNFRHYKDPEYERAPFWKTLKAVIKHHDLSSVFSAYLFLRFFYAWMIIYTPIYLHAHIGLHWDSIGIIFTIMLLPFVLLEYPLGRVADSSLGEKEMMVAGFIVMAIATGVITFITSSSIWIWAIVLFATRVGASTVQVMGETYFFKKIDSADSSLLGFFRMTGPIAYILAPLAGSLFLYFFDFRFIFITLGILMLGGMWFAIRMRDTL